MDHYLFVQTRIRIYGSSFLLEVGLITTKVNKIFQHLNRVLIRNQIRGLMPGV